MTVIGSIYAKLKPKDQRLLDYALEHSLSQFVKLDGGKYVGVHVETIRNLRPEVVTGVWSYGDIL